MIEYNIGPYIELYHVLLIQAIFVKLVIISIRKYETEKIFSIYVFEKMLV